MIRRWFAPRDAGDSLENFTHHYLEQDHDWRRWKQGDGGYMWEDLILDSGGAHAV